MLVAAVRLIRRNVDVLMDLAPAEAAEAAREAIARIEPPVDLRRLRMRYAAGRHFADVVVAVAPGAAVGQGHAVADAVEDAVQRALPESDVVVHVEPVEDDAGIRDRARAAALTVGRVREVHNVTVLHVGDRPAVSLHLKLPGELPLEQAHAVAEEVERAIGAAVPEVESVQRTSSRSRRRASAGPRPGGRARRGRARRAGDHRRRVAFPAVPPHRRGPRAHLTLAVDPEATLAEAHARRATSRTRSGRRARASPT